MTLAPTLVVEHITDPDSLVRYRVTFRDLTACGTTLEAALRVLERAIWEAS